MHIEDREPFIFHSSLNFYLHVSPIFFSDTVCIEDTYQVLYFWGFIIIFGLQDRFIECSRLVMFLVLLNTNYFPWVRSIAR